MTELEATIADLRLAVASAEADPWEGDQHASPRDLIVPSERITELLDEIDRLCAERRRRSDDYQDLSRQNSRLIDELNRLRERDEAAKAVVQEWKTFTLVIRPATRTELGRALNALARAHEEEEADS